METLKQTLHTIDRIFKIIFAINIKYIFFLIILSLTNLTLSFLNLYNTQYIINTIQSKGTLTSSLLLFIVAMPVISIAIEISSQTSSFLSMTYQDFLNYKFSTLILKKVRDHTLSDFENSSFYDLLQRAETAGGTYPYSIITTLISMISQIISIFTYAIIIFYWKPWALILLALFPVLSTFQLLELGNNEFKVINSRASLERKSWYYAYLQNKDVNIKETILYSLFTYFFDKFQEIRLLFIRENKNLALKRSITLSIIQILSILCSTVIIYTAIYDTVSGILLIGSLMTYISVTTNVKSSIHLIISSFFKIYNDSLYAKNIIDFLDFPTSISIQTNNPHNVEIEEIKKIELKNLSFKYCHKNSYALKNINMVFTSNNKYIFVGRNGSGKSTLAKLIMGFYMDYEGDIIINDINLKNIYLPSLRTCISAVFQDFSLYQTTIKDSIIMSDLNRIDDNALESAAQKANAVDFINRFPQKYEQQIGNWFQEGVQLSGGEWQKLSIARAFYRTGASLVICDEPSSSLDPISEREVMANFFQLISNKIGILITHRFQYLNNEAVYVVFKEGKIIDNGKHSELLKKSLEYRKLWERDHDQ
ncbi:ABC transporter ATP-binding protein [Streptococcus ruminantium]|uniref:ABC transporter ATP-binding protein n=1 Tax=Streptococcus ruminantium TaxID=1917441 RepID=UPI0013EF3525|nr:ABC transporter ATP-binding protein [Streptococcus ruminantium]